MAKHSPEILTVSTLTKKQIDFNISIAKCWVQQVQGNDNRPSTGEIEFSHRYLIGITTALHYIGFLPFRLRWSLQLGRVERHSNKLRRIVCFLIHSFILGAAFFTVYQNYYRKPILEGTPLTFRGAVLYSSGMGVCLYFIYTAWFNSHSLEWLLTKFPTFPTGKRMKPYSCYDKIENCLAVLSPLVSLFVNLVASFGEAPYYDFGWDIEGRMKSIWKRLAFLGVIFCFILVIHMGSLIFYGVALIFRDRARVFIGSLEEADVEDDEEKDDRFQSGSLVADHFFELEAFMNGVNGRFGGWILIRILFVIPYYSKKVLELMEGEGTVANGTLTIWYTFMSFFWLLSTAGISNRICERMKIWLVRTRNYNQLSTRQLTILTSKLSPDSIALRGGNFFAISYPFVGTLTSLTFTWAFIDQKGYGNI